MNNRNFIITFQRCQVGDGHSATPFRHTEISKLVQTPNRLTFHNAQPQLINHTTYRDQQHLPTNPKIKNAISRRLKSPFNKFQSSVALHTGTGYLICIGKSNDLFLYRKHWAEKGLSNFSNNNLLRLLIENSPAMFQQQKSN